MNLEEIKARHTKATKGPYVWRWPCGGIAPELIAPHSGLLLVMDAVREGMMGAAIRFAEREGNRGGIMRKLTDLCAKPTPRTPEWIVMDNPDANAMAHSWQDIDDLIGEVERLTQEASR